MEVGAGPRSTGEGEVASHGRVALVHAGAGQVNEGAALVVSFEVDEASGRATQQRNL